jgi:hypothetical protein
MLKVDVWESQKISEVEAVSHQRRPTPRVAVRPLQSRVSKFRLSSRSPELDLGSHLHIRNADYLLVRCANPIPHSVNVLGLDRHGAY